MGLEQGVSCLVYERILNNPYITTITLHFNLTVHCSCMYLCTVCMSVTPRDQAQEMKINVLVCCCNGQIMFV